MLTITLRPDPRPPETLTAVKVAFQSRTSEELVWHANEYTGAVARVWFATASAAMRHVHSHLVSLLHHTAGTIGWLSGSKVALLGGGPAGGLSVEVADGPDAARIFLESCSES